MTLTVLGINRTQDASICLLRGNDIVAMIAKERLTRRKHDWGAVGDFDQFYVPSIPELRETPIDVIVECFSTQELSPHKEQLYREELQRTLRLTPRTRFLRLSHHFAHLYSAYDPSGFDDAAVMVIDAQGSHLRNLTEHWRSGPTDDPRLREIMSFYQCRAGERTCLAKQAWDGTMSHVAGLGMFYYQLTQTFFRGEGNEGKVMGLAPYGRAERGLAEGLRVEDAAVYFSEGWRSALVDTPVRYDSQAGDEQFQQAADFAASGQKAFEDALVAVACWLHHASGLDDLCFAGGTALNCSANTRLLRDTPFKRLFIPPTPGDAGTALGCALYGMEQLTGVRPTFRWETDYLGPASAEQSLNLERDVPAGWHIARPPQLWERLADLLASGLTVGLAQGRSESGPRALGHRSILADPRRPHIKEHVNRDIKGREWFRPLAPVVPLDEVSLYFDLDGPCPFMQWTALVRPEYWDKIPAVVHCDGTARLQTVTPEQNADLYHLLKLFRERTGIGVLLNTSFNGKDEPIVESAADALRCLETTALDAVVMPPFILSKSALD